VNVTAHLKGNLNEQQALPEFEVEVLRQEPGEAYQLGQTQILSILALGRVDPSFSESIAGENISLSDLALRQSGQYLGGRFASLVGLDEAQFELDTENIENSRFLFTKSLTNRLALTYASTFGLHGEPRIGVEYQIQRYLAVRGERNEQGKYAVDLKIEQRF
jgi:autotransporter translocation and assembly factor TamB